MELKQKLSASIQRRFKTDIAPQNPVKFVLQLPFDDVINQAIATVYLYTRSGKGPKKSIFLTEIITAIGHSLRNKFRLPKDSALAARAGAFLLYSFEELELLKVVLGKGNGKHATYVVDVLNDKAIAGLWEKLPSSRIEKLPSETPYCPWETAFHPSGACLVKTQNTEVLAKLTAETHPIVFDCVNKSQSIGWRINQPIHELQAWALRNKADAFAEIWNMQNPVAKQSKIREAEAIGSIAERFIGKTFYH